MVLPVWRLLTLPHDLLLAAGWCTASTWACCIAEAFGLKQEQGLEGGGGAVHGSFQVLELLVQLGALAAGGLGPWQLIEEGVHLLASHRHQRQPLRW